jgi:DNA-binding NtrC family response regulator
MPTETEPAPVRPLAAASNPTTGAVAVTAPIARPEPQPAAEPAGIAARFRLPSEGVSLESVELSLVEQAIGRSGGNQTRAAELLGISRDQLRYRLKKLEGPHGEVNE